MCRGSGDCGGRADGMSRCSCGGGGGRGRITGGEVRGT